MSVVYKMGSKISLIMDENGNYGDFNYLSNLQVYYFTGFPQETSLVMGGDEVPNTDDIFNIGSDSYTFSSIYVNNIITKNSQLNIKGSGNFNGYINSSGYTNNSDIRIKTDIVPLNSSESLDIINKINPLKFTQHNPTEDINSVPGFVAQDIFNIYPSAIDIVDGYIPNINKYYPTKEIYRTETYFTYTIDISDLNLLYPQDLCLRIDNLKHAIYKTAKSNIVEFNSNSSINYIYIFGTKVYDFHQLSYDYIYTLNVSATQELTKIIKNQQLTIDNLKEELLKLTDRILALENSRT